MWILSIDIRRTTPLSSSCGQSFDGAVATSGACCMAMPAFAAILTLLAIVLAPLSAHGVDSSLWNAVQEPGHVVLIRHALAPGTGDPPEFSLRDCATQRNLSDAGREQAVRIGHRFLDNGIKNARVYSSQWCRCLETAALLDLGDVTELPALNSFFRRFEREEEQTAEVLA